VEGDPVTDCYGKHRKNFREKYPDMPGRTAHERSLQYCRDKPKSLVSHGRIAAAESADYLRELFGSLRPGGFSECISQRRQGSKRPCDPYELCGEPPSVYKLTQSRLTRPSAGPTHLTDVSLHDDYRDYMMMSVAPFPPDGKPTGGATGVSVEELAELYKNSDYYKCQVDVNVRHAAALRLDWKFWVGLGAGALGVTLLVATKKG
jgi:hypothetical protein